MQSVTCPAIWLCSCDKDLSLWCVGAGIKAGHGQSSVVSLQARAGMPKVSSFGSLPRTLSDQSMRKRSMDGDRGLPVQPFTSQIDKAESIASTAVRTADKINVSSGFNCFLTKNKHLHTPGAMQGAALWCLYVHSGCLAVTMASHIV